MQIAAVQYEGSSLVIVSIALLILPWIVAFNARAVTNQSLNGELSGWTAARYIMAWGIALAALVAMYNLAVDEWSTLIQAVYLILAIPTAMLTGALVVICAEGHRAHT